MKSIAVTALVLSVLLLSGCSILFNPARKPHAVSFTQGLSIPKSKEGNGISVGLGVIDDRSSPILGLRGQIFKGAVITSPTARRYILKEIVKGLEARGFIVVAHDQQADVYLLVSLRVLTWEETVCGIWKCEYVNSSIKVEGEKSGQSYLELYPGDYQDKGPTAPGSRINHGVTASMSNSLRKMLMDRSLLDFLTS